MAVSVIRALIAALPTRVLLSTSADLLRFFGFMIFVPRTKDRNSSPPPCPFSCFFFVFKQLSRAFVSPCLIRVPLRIRETGIYRGQNRRHALKQGHVEQSNIYGRTEEKSQDDGSIVKLDVLLWWRCGWRAISLMWFKVMLEEGFASFCLDVRFLEGTVTDRNRCMRFHCTRAPPPPQLRSSGDCWWHVLSAQLSIPSGGSTFAHYRTWCNGAILGYAASSWWFSIDRARFVV